MSAADHLQPEQLKMLMSRGEITRDYFPVDLPYYGFDRAKMWRAKRSESRRDGTFDSVQAEGVHTPVHLGHQQRVFEGDALYGKALIGGHHRVASSKRDQLIPVVHHNDINEAAGGRWERAYGWEYT